MNTTVEYCRSCMSESPVGAVNLDDTYVTVTNERINFSTMFRETTSIDPDLDCFSKKLCSLCIESLRIAFEFRRQSWVAQEALTKRFNPAQESKLPVVKIERVEIEPKVELTEVLLDEFPPLDIQLKEEEDQISGEGNDNEGADSDDEFAACFNPGTGYKTRKYKKPPNPKRREPKPLTKHRCYSYGCNKVFSTSYELSRHIEQMIKNGNGHMFECGYCSKQFNLRKHLLSHLVNNHREVTCKLCHQIFTGTFTLDTHNRRHHKVFNDIPTPCPICKKVFKNKRRMICHKTYKHKNIPKEDKILKANDDLKPVDVSQRWKGHYCYAYECNELFRTSSELLEHLAAMEGRPDHMYHCEICNKKFPKKDRIRIHINTFHAEVPCTICSATIGSRYLLARHIRFDHKINNDVETECPVCHKMFASRRLMTIHKLNHTNKKEYKFYCEICGKASTKKTIHDAHLKTHDEAKPFSCEICGKAFRTKGQLGFHVETHGTERNYECDICGLKVKNRGYLKEHKKIHSKKYEVACDECGLVFPRMSYLRGHKISHAQRQEIECPVCFKTYKSEKHLKTHMKHHEEPKCRCPICGKGFIKEDIMRLHISATHEKQRKYLCEYQHCDKSYLRRSHLLHHMKTIHLGLGQKKM